MMIRPVRMLFYALTALAKCGKNINKLCHKVKDPKVGFELMKRLKNISVVRKARYSDDITLPTVGAAFSGPYYLIRSMHEKSYKTKL
jgi:hypothetical protein